MLVSALVPLTLLLTTTNAAISYWIDPVTCTEDRLIRDPPPENQAPRWPALMGEIHKFGSSADWRLTNQDQNPDYRRAFNWVFGGAGLADKNQRIDYTFGKAKGVRLFLVNLRTMQQALDHSLANVRIYCDNDKRFVPKEDGKGYKDEVNHISTQHRWCQETKDAGAATYVDTTNVDGHPNPRSTITLCDDLFSRNDGKWLIDDIGTGKDWAYDHKSINWIRSTVTGILTHELAHVPPMATLDIHGKDSYGWDFITHMSADDSFNNADSYNYAVLMAMFADRKYALNRDDPVAQGLGELVKYNDIPSVPAEDLNAASSAADQPTRDGAVKRSFASRINRWMFS